MSSDERLFFRVSNEEGKTNTSWANQACLDLPSLCLLYLTNAAIAARNSRSEFLVLTRNAKVQRTQKEASARWALWHTTHLLYYISSEFTYYI